jgi:hypothetical protein
MVLGGWLLYFNWLQRPIHYRNYIFTAKEASRLKPFARAQYAHGLHAWYRNDREAAAEFFKEAVSEEVLFVDAWLRLAEAEASLGDTVKSRNILRFTNALTDDVYRWKWPEILIAREIGMNEILYRNANYLLSRRALKQDTLQLLHFHFDRDAAATMAVIDPENLILYLKWLMRWNMTAESLLVWQKIGENGKPGSDTGLQYAHFLLGQKRIAESISVWQEYLPLDGMVNAGFENEISQRGFDWRYWGDKDDNWTIQRVNQEAHEGDHSLRISFGGRENITFLNLYQIVPVAPHQRLQLHYAWKSENISTDQGPFIEIVGYEQYAVFQSGPMMTGTHGWRKESIEFQTPAGCRAALVRVRRRPSHRFDSKIKGSLWIDNFRLEILSSDEKQVLSEKFL